MLDGNKYGAHVATINALRENDPHSFGRYLRMSSEVYEVRMVTCSECNCNEKLVNFVPRTFYDFEVIFTLLFFHFIQALLSQPAKTVSSIQLLTIFEKTPSYMFD